MPINVALILRIKNNVELGRDEEIKKANKGYITNSLWTNEAQYQCVFSQNPYKMLY